MENRIDELVQSLLDVNRINSIAILNDCNNEIESLDLIEKLIVPVMKRIGDGWESGTVALSQVYMSGKLIEEWVNTILPTSDSKRKNQPNMAIAVLEDYHMLGKRIIYSILRASGFNLRDYGHVNVSELVNKIKEDKLEVILISTLMLPSALKIKILKEELRKNDVAVKIIVGGAPFRFDNQLWKEVGADAEVINANDTISIIEEVIKKK